VETDQDNEFGGILFWEGKKKHEGGINNFIDEEKSNLIWSNGGKNQKREVVKSGKGGGSSRPSGRKKMGDHGLQTNKIDNTRWNSHGLVRDFED